MPILTLTNLSDKASIKVNIDVQGEFDQIIKESNTQEFKLIKRQSNSQWEDIKTFKYSQEESNYEYNDILVENNIRYEYAVAFTDSYIADDIEERSIIASFEGNWLCEKDNSIRVKYDNNTSSMDKPQLLSQYYGNEELTSTETFVTNKKPKILKGDSFGLMIVAVLKTSYSYNGVEGTFKLSCIEVGDAYDSFTLKNNGLL